VEIVRVFGFPDEQNVSKEKDLRLFRVAGAADTADHVLAREFVAVEHRGQIPKVPAAGPVTTKKQQIENTHGRPALGGRHAEALDNLTATCRKRPPRTRSFTAISMPGVRAFGRPNLPALCEPTAVARWMARGWNN